MNVRCYTIVYHIPKKHTEVNDDEEPKVNVDALCHRCSLLRNDVLDFPTMSNTFRDRLRLTGVARRRAISRHHFSIVRQDRDLSIDENETETTGKVWLLRSTKSRRLVFMWLFWP